MFVGVARVSLQIPESSSLKSKRQVVRKVVDRIRARFNVSMAEVEDNELWQKATLAASVVGNERAFVNEQLEKIIHSIEDMYLAPVVSLEKEVLGFDERIFGGGAGDDQTLELPFAREDRTLAEAEGMGEWSARYGTPKPKLNTESSSKEKRDKARALRNPREWEK